MRSMVCCVIKNKNNPIMLKGKTIVLGVTGSIAAYKIANLASMLVKKQAEVRQNMVQKKIPMRQCLGCREMFPKRELIRVVRSPEGEITLDFKGKAPGRGAYLCGRPECLKKARKSRAIERALSVTVPETVYDQLEQQMEQEGAHGE